MTLSLEQQLIADLLNYKPLAGDDAFEAADISACRLPTRMQDEWPQVKWHGEWIDVPTMEQIEEWVFDSACDTPGGDIVEPDSPDSWLSILSMV